MAGMSDLVRIILEAEGVSPDRQVELDRLILRMYSSPGLITHLKNVKFVDDDTAEIEFAFLPKQQVPIVQAMIGPVPVQAFEYKKDGEPYHGFKFKTSDLVKWFSRKDKEKD